jgi:riboflavin synthase
VIFKGSLSIEGISLTVAKIEGTRVSTAIIPHTTKMTNLTSLKAGDAVNLEVDVVAKYIEKMIRRESGGSSLTVERLVGEGF